MSEVVDLQARRWESEGDPNSHVPASALRECLRQIEAGELIAEHLIIFFGHIDEEGQSQTGYFQAGKFCEFAQSGLAARGLRLITSFDG